MQAPNGIAVRSSCVNLEDGAGHAFAGLFETVLNRRTVDEVGDAIKVVRCMDII